MSRAYLKLRSEQLDLWMYQVKMRRQGCNCPGVRLASVKHASMKLGSALEPPVACAAKYCRTFWWLARMRAGKAQIPVANFWHTNHVFVMAMSATGQDVWRQLSN